MKNSKKNNPILMSCFKFKKTLEYDFTINYNIIINPNNKYWTEKSELYNMSAYSYYIKYIKKYFKNSKSTWNNEKDALLRDLINKKEAWIVIGYKLNTHPIKCIKRLYQLENTKSSWTCEEDEKLLELIKSFTNDWVRISSYFNGKSRSQCLQRYKKLIEGKRKGKWSKDEDNLLIKAVNEHMNKGWKYVSRFIPNRSDSQCRERWIYSLDPTIKKGKWSMEEDEMLLSKSNKTWQEISSSIVGRNIKQCKRRYKLLHNK